MEGQHKCPGSLLFGKELILVSLRCKKKMVSIDRNLPVIFHFHIPYKLTYNRNTRVCSSGILQTTQLKMKNVIEIIISPITVL